jgi:SAM-dependent methyltransferase
VDEPSLVSPHPRPLSRPALEARLAALEPEEARWTLIDYLDGRASAEVTLPRLILALGLVEEVEASLDQVARSWQPPVPQALRRLVRMVRERRRGLERVADTLGDHPDPEAPFSSLDEGIDAYRRFFDRAVRRDEPSSVAAHSLGDPEVLEKSTLEVVQLFELLGVLGTDRHALEIGCGIGRFLSTLAPRLASIHGTDISPRMIETARRHCADLPNAFLSVTSGRDLADFEAARFDLVFAADSFPYIHHTGRALAALHIREAARVLRPGGDLVVLNYSYRDDVNTDRREVARLCASCGFELLANGEQPLRLWDAYLFHARRMGEDG